MRAVDSVDLMGLEVKDMISRYIAHRYSQAFLRDTDVHCVSRISHDPTRMAYRLTLSVFPGIDDKKQYQVEMFIDEGDANQNRDKHEWFLYQTQAIIPQLDSGIFSVWLQTRSLADGERRAYDNRVLPQVEQVRLINSNPDQHQVSFNSLAVIKMKNGCEWRETLDQIELDPTAFIAALLMVTP